MAKYVMLFFITMDQLQPFPRTWMTSTPCRVPSLWRQTGTPFMAVFPRYLNNSCNVLEQNYYWVQLYAFVLYSVLLISTNLLAQVDSIRPKSASHLWTVRSNLGSAHYKAVILAAPFHSAGITLPSTLSSQIPEQHSIRVHVTVLTTTAPSPNSEYFALPDSYHLPTKILTTSEGARNGGKEPEFYSISYHDLGTAGEWAVKIVSNNSLSDEWLLRVFSGQVGWVYRKVGSFAAVADPYLLVPLQWGAYPKLTPTSSFPPVKLDQGLYYVHAFEPCVVVHYLPLSGLNETSIQAHLNTRDGNGFLSQCCGSSPQ